MLLQITIMHKNKLIPVVRFFCPSTLLQQLPSCNLHDRQLPTPKPMPLLPAHVGRFIKAGVKMSSGNDASTLEFTVKEMIIKIMDNQNYGIYVIWENEC